MFRVQIWHVCIAVVTMVRICLCNCLCFLCYVRAVAPGTDGLGVVHVIVCVFISQITTQRHADGVTIVKIILGLCESHGL